LLPPGTLLNDGEAKKTTAEDDYSRNQKAVPAWDGADFEPHQKKKERQVDRGNEGAARPICRVGKLYDTHWLAYDFEDYLCILSAWKFGRENKRPLPSEVLHCRRK